MPNNSYSLFLYNAVLCWLNMALNIVTPTSKFMENKASRAAKLLRVYFTIRAFNQLDILRWNTFPCIMDKSVFPIYM